MKLIGEVLVVIWVIVVLVVLLFKWFIGIVLNFDKSELIGGEFRSDGLGRKFVMVRKWLVGVLLKLFLMILFIIVLFIIVLFSVV